MGFQTSVSFIKVFYKSFFVNGCGMSGLVIHLKTTRETCVTAACAAGSFLIILLLARS